MKAKNWCTNVGVGTTSAGTASTGTFIPTIKNPNNNDILTLNALQNNKT